MNADSLGLDESATGRDILKALTAAPYGKRNVIDVPKVRFTGSAVQVLDVLPDQCGHCGVPGSWTEGRRGSKTTQYRCGCCGNEVSVVRHGDGVQIP